MTYIERNQLLNSNAFNAQCRVALCDWVEYWVTMGTASIQDEHQRTMTDNFLRAYLEEPDACSRKVAILAISETAIKDAAEVTDAAVATAVTTLMATALDYLI